MKKQTYNQISQSAGYRQDDISVSITVCGGSYGGGSEVLVVQNQYDDVRIYNDCCPCLKAEMGGGLPMILDRTVYDASRRHDYEPFDGDICETVQAHYGTGGGNVPIVVETLVFDEGQITCPTNGLNPQWGGQCHSLSGNAGRTVVIIKENSDEQTQFRLGAGPCNLSGR